MVGWHGIFERLGLPVSRVAGSVDGRTRADDGPRCGMCHRDAVWAARSSDEAGGALAGVVGAAPRMGGCLPLERWRCSVTRLVLSNSRLRLSSEPRMALPKPTSQARPDRLRRGIGRAAL